MEKNQSRYSSRNASPSPMEEDSDPEFRSGPYIPEKKRKRVRRASSPPTSRKKRHSEESGETVKEYNPLKEYFGNTDFLSDSDRDSLSDDGDDEREEDEDDLKSDAEADDELEEQSKINALSSSRQETPIPDSSNNKGTDIVDDSATELDSAYDEWKPPPPPKSQQVDDSATESDSDAPVVASQSLKPSAKGTTFKLEDSDSETESDSEAEAFLMDPFKPRPAFVLAPGQRYLRPLVLDEEKKIMVPESINTHLRDYQRKGVNFFYRQYSENRGGLLGDDMGLGMNRKTIQVISFLSAIMQKTGRISERDRRRNYVSELQDGKQWRRSRKLPPANDKWPTCLIIAPSSVVYNWQRELETWGYFEFGMYVGTPKEREPVLNDFKLGRLDIVVTSFELARQDIDLLDDLPWSCIFVDEVHRLKNQATGTAKAYEKFACQCRFGLTGTMIQNSYEEMWTILNWTNPNQLGTLRQWKRYVVKPLTEGQSASATDLQRAKAVIVANTLVTELLPKFFLRRTKDIIKDQLPKKTDQVVFCPLSRKQIDAYKNILKTGTVQNLIRKDEPCTCRSGKRRGVCCFRVQRGDLLRYLSILIKLSNHVGLIFPGPEDTPEQVEKLRDVVKAAFPDGNRSSHSFLMLDADACGKWRVLDILLKQWHKDPSNKVLVFTKSVKLLRMIEYHLKRLGYGHLKLDGNTKHADRMPMIDQFHNDSGVFVFLISTLAGGTGLNLTGANKVVIFDPNWNPAHDLQAMDRAFRFGQTRDVSVYRLLGAGSVEELIYARQIYKQQQMAIGYDASVQTRYFEGIQGDNTKKGELFGIKNIFKLDEDKVSTKMTIEKANMAELGWALANMDGRMPGKHKSKDKEGGLEDDAGLDKLMFDDASPVVPTKEQIIIQKSFDDIGVKYWHNNEEIIAPSAIEQERAKQAVVKEALLLLTAEKEKTKAKQKKKQDKKTRPAKKRAKGTPPGSSTHWPPRRSHHTWPERILNTINIEKVSEVLGWEGGPADFKRRFAKQSLKEQEDTLLLLHERFQVDIGANFLQAIKQRQETRN